MPDLSWMSGSLALFMVAGWLLNLTPGPDVLCIASHSLRHGIRAGLIAGLGVGAGCFVHVAAAGLGVAALLSASTTAFTLLKWVGAAYLLWQGVKALRGRGGGVLPDAVGETPGPAGGCANAGRDAAPAPAAGLAWRAWFAIGFLTNALNPKVALFFLAFVPQFIAPEAANKAQAFWLLGALFVVNAIPVNAGWALLAGWMARHPAVQRHTAWLDRAAGLMFIGFGLKLALTDNPPR